MAMMAQAAWLVRFSSSTHSARWADDRNEQRRKAMFKMMDTDEMKSHMEFANKTTVAIVGIEMECLARV
jgi:hypothetical protein